MSFEVQKLIFDGCFKVNITLQNILEAPATIADQFPCKIKQFSIENREHIRKLIKIGILRRGTIGTPTPHRRVGGVSAYVNLSR